MKALCITAPRAAEYRTLPMPVPGPGEVLLRVGCVGYCGSDLTTWRGLNPLVTYPRIPGHEVAGTITGFGTGVTGFTIGDEVLVMPYTSCGDCPACRGGRFNCCRGNQTLGVQRDGALTEWLVAPTPKLIAAAGLDLRELALVEPLTIGFHAVDRARVAAGDIVAVFGCGMIGLGAVAGAAARGARVISIDVDDRKLELARAAGAAEVVNTRTGDLHAALTALTGGDGPTVMIEAVGLPETFRGCVEEVAFAGRVVYIGYAKAPVQYETRFFVQKELDVLGSRNATPADFVAVIAHLRSGRFPLSATVSRTVPFAEAHAALGEWDRDPGAVTKIVVDMAAP